VRLRGSIRFGGLTPLFRHLPDWSHCTICPHETRQANRIALAIPSACEEKELIASQDAMSSFFNASSS